MTDQSLRTFERRWRESGLLEDEARYLLALVRAAAFDPAKLVLAGLLGHEAAALATEIAGNDQPLPQVPLLRISRSFEHGRRWRITWTSGFTHTLRLFEAAEAVHPHALLVARCGVVDGCLAVLTQARPGQRLPGRFLAATRRWIDCPCPRHLRKVCEVHAKLSKSTTRPRRGLPHEAVADAALRIWDPTAAPVALPFRPLEVAFEATGASWDDACEHAQSWLYDWSRPPLPALESTT